eukprot:TRINITY_DN5431_c0_g1_i3.p1 TRINITY_DN5431_c0_g1~~TRINITY_DN5431_c0_g1_i3.p1  ORF type:complete len:489 (+),score=62.67 TRINITY_DN5431_c0_g1_i3:838-2304(+)
MFVLCNPCIKQSSFGSPVLSLKSPNFSMRNSRISAGLQVRASLNGKFLPNIEVTQSEKLEWAILGDLHLSQQEMNTFYSARDQINQGFEISKSDGYQTHVIQLGDLGAYEAKPGSAECFTLTKQYLEGFDASSTLITGNHDLEGEEFLSDEENLATWQEAFQQNHYWAMDYGCCVAIGLSTVKFRSNTYSVHEVHISQDQLDWFETTLNKYAHKPVVVFTHAPPLGCGLRVINKVHVKNRCAWLNHSSNPEIFMQIAQKHSNIKLWFSGHFHLSHNYADSVSFVSGTLFVQTGVIGACSKDGFSQSRLLRVTEEGYELFTRDHYDGSLRQDVKGLWKEKQPEVVTPEDELVCDPDAGYVCGFNSCSLLEPPNVTWLNTGSIYQVALQDNMLIEYDISTFSPIGAACLDVAGRDIVLLDSQNQTVSNTGTTGDEVVAIELRSENGEIERIERNQDNAFYRIYQPNKWVKKQMEKALQESLLQEVSVAAK